MIPQKIQRKHILAAMREIDRDGVPPGRESRKFHLKSGPTGDRIYPPKYVISLAYKFVTGREWPSWKFSGGQGDERLPQEPGV